MIHASQQLLTTLQQSHKVATKAVVMSGKDPLLELSVIDGNVTVDANSKHRRTATVKLSDPTGSLVPHELTDMLHPLSGNEIWLYRGAYVPQTGQDELCQLGAYVVKDGEVMDSGSDLAINLKLVDKSLVVSRARKAHPEQYGPNSLSAVLWAVVLLEFPAVEFANNFPAVRPWVQCPTVVLDRGVDLWEITTKWARDGGLDLYFDHEGKLALTPLPAGNPSAEDVVWEFEEGELSTMLSVRKDVTSSDTYNHVVCYSQRTDGVAPVWGEAMVTDPNHPLSIYGRMGDIPFFYSSPLFTSAEQCEAVAQALLYKHLGHTEHIHFNSIVNPCLTDGDIVAVRRDRSKIDNYYVLDKLTIPMVSIRAMECDTRERFILDTVT